MNDLATATWEHQDSDMVAELQGYRSRIAAEMSRRIIGQHSVIDHLLVALFARGHGLFVGVPGLAKTLLIQTLADVLDLGFNRVQFTPDLMPSDITGTDIIETDDAGKRHYVFVRGPVFCNLLLADEINRTPPKTQAALLQSMQERRVTAGGRTYELAAPFHVFATQNPIEQEGTYPLPEAQLDRFMMMLRVEYPTAEEEIEIVRRTTSRQTVPVEKVLSPLDLLRFQDLVLRVPIAAPIVDLAVRIVRRTRPGTPDAPASVAQYVTYGAGPRAAQHLVLAAKARCILDGRAAVDGHDVRALALPVLRHRLVVNFHAEAQKVSVEQILEEILASLTD